MCLLAVPWRYKFTMTVSHFHKPVNRYSPQVISKYRYNWRWIMQLSHVNVHIYLDSYGYKAVVWFPMRDRYSSWFSSIWALVWLIRWVTILSTGNYREIDVESNVYSILALLRNVMISPSNSVHLTHIPRRLASRRSLLEVQQEQILLRVHINYTLDK